MLIIVVKWIVLLFGGFILFVAMLMLFTPKKARAMLRKAGSTIGINYGELTLRLFIGIALVVYAANAKFPEAFSVFGWFMIITALLLFLVPKKLHHAFSIKSADLLKPFYVRLLSPFAMLLGGSIIYNTL
jgi:uncharacterized membrane protein YfcA